MNIIIDGENVTALDDIKYITMYIYAKKTIWNKGFQDICLSTLGILFKTVLIIDFN